MKKKATVFVLLVYVDDSDYCNVPHVFWSMAALKKFVEDGIRDDYNDTCAMDCKDAAKMEEEIASMKTAFDERGCWRDGQGNFYDCQRREIEG